MKAASPRNRAMQDLFFFDRIERPRSAGAEDDDLVEEGDDREGDALPAPVS